MALHAKLCPPSGWDRWSVCSASVDLQTNEGSVYADEGTAAHLLAATALENELKAADYIGQRIWVPDAQDQAEGECERFLVGDEDPLTGRIFEVDHGMADAVQDYVDQVLVQDRDYIQFETAVPIGHITGEEGATGTADCIRVHGTTLAVHDLKFGQGKKVFAEANGQLLIYLLGAIKNLDWYGDFDKFEIHIHQPRLGHHDVWTLDLPTLMSWAEEIRHKALPITQEGHREFMAGPSACRFCDYRSSCAERERFVQSEVIDEFPIQDQPELAEDKAKLLKALEHVEMVEQWCKDVWKAAADADNAEPGCLPGWGHFAGRGSRKIIDEERLVKRLKGWKFKLDDYMPRSLLSAAQVEELVGRARYATLAKDKLVEKIKGKPVFGRDTGKKERTNTPEAQGFPIANEGDE